MTLSGDGPHAALMDGLYRHQRHAYDVTRSIFLLGRDRLIDDLAPPQDGTVLEIGCGTGRNLVVAAERSNGSIFYGIDISSEMLRTARRSVAASRAGKRITVAQGDAVSFDPRSVFDRDKFDRIFFSYSLSMIPNWQAALARAATMLTADGKLLTVDFGQCQGLPPWFRRGLLAWLGLFHVTPRADLIRFMGELAASCGARIVWQPLFRDYAWRTTLDFS